MTQKTLRSAVRCRPMKTIQALTAASNHSRRIDGASKARLREGATRGEGLTWSLLFRNPEFDRSRLSDNRNVVKAFKAHKIKHGVTTDRGDLGAHLILSVPAAWLADAGSIHDAKNPRNRAAFKQGIRWAEAAFGKDSVYHARMDFDEKGGGVVDIFVAPVRVDKRSNRPRISRYKALKEIQVRRGRRKSYEALQDDWADWCQLYLDPTILRGVPKVETRAENLSVEEYYEARRIAQVAIDAKVDQANQDALMASEERRIAEGARAEAEELKRQTSVELADVRSLRAALAQALQMVKRAYRSIKHLWITADERNAAQRLVGNVQVLTSELTATPASPCPSEADSGTVSLLDDDNSPPVQF